MYALYSLRRLFLPVVLLITALFVRESVAGLSTEYQQLLYWMPYVALGIAMLLCIYYNHARLFTITLVLLLVYYLVCMELQTTLAEVRAFFVYSFISVSLPLILLLFYFIPERGLRNRYGALIVSVVPVSLIIAVVVFNAVPEATLMVAMNDYFSIRPFNGYLLSVNASVCYVVTLLAGLYRLYKINSEYIAALLSVLLFVFVTLAYFNLQNISIVMFSVVGVSLILSQMHGAYEMAYRDDLTGLLGRRSLNERLKGLGKRYVLAMIDVDHFKKFNDTHGHDIGDEVLKMVARHIAAVKGGGTAYRYGGEEFCIVFTGKDIEYCMPFLETVHANIEAHRMILRDTEHRSKSSKSAKARRGRRSKSRGDKTVSVTISIGIAEPNDKYRKVNKVLKAADTALYMAKQRGRNCIATI